MTYAHRIRELLLPPLAALCVCLLGCDSPAPHGRDAGSPHDAAQDDLDAAVDAGDADAGDADAGDAGAPDGSAHEAGPVLPPWSCDSGSYVQAVLADAPDAFWPLEARDANDGQLTPDLSGNDHHLKVQEPKEGTAVFGEAGVTLSAGASLTIGSLEAPQGPTRLATVEFWARLDAPDSEATLMAFLNSERGDPNYARSTIDLKRIAQYQGDHLEVLDERFEAQAELGGLHHIVITIDRDRDEGQIFVDGQALLKPPAVTMSKPERGEHPLVVAKSQTSVTLHDFAVYPNVLTSEQVAEHCRCGFGPEASRGKCP